MSVSVKFQNFCSNIRITTSVASDISYRYKRITKQLNKDFWNTESDTSHSLYVGSYGRDTDIHVSDIDVLFQLPYSVYERINGHSGNGQSALLAEVRDSLRNTYGTTHISSDGQIVGIKFDDGVNFEILPCFVNKDGSYTYPDSNNGGSWKTTNPKPEIEEIKKTNDSCNGNLKNLCRMARSWKDKWDVPMGGLLIDTLAYQFIKQWTHRNESYLYYDYMTRDFFEYLKNQDENKTYWLAVGSGQYVYKKGDFQYKALRGFNIAEEAIDYEQREMPASANGKWKEIYGTKF
ncbi:MAG: nucleotidyltransferase [bacterium]|nr:nucleotidyltransferase [bacterium]